MGPMFSSFLMSDVGGITGTIPIGSISLNIQEIIGIFPFIFLCIGIVYSFLGKKFFDEINFVIGGSLAAGLFYVNYFSPDQSFYLILIIVFLLFGALAFLVPYLLVAVMGFALGVGFFIAASPFLGFILGIAFAIFAVVLLRLLLPIVTALIGGVMSGFAVLELTGFQETFFITVSLLLVAGSAFQFLLGDSIEISGSSEE